MTKRPKNCCTIANRTDGTTHLNVIVPVVVEVDDSVHLGVEVDLDVLGLLHALAQALPRVLLHLDVVKLSAREQGEKGR